MIPKRIGFIVFDGVTAIDLFGPAEAFSVAEVKDKQGFCPAYQILTIGLTNRTCVTESGVRVQPQRTLQNAPSLDTLIIPGGHGLRKAAIGDPIAAFVKERSRSTNRIGAICTGIYGLASTGLLKGRKVTTHWRFAKDVARRFPDLTVDDNALFLRDGKFFTSAGAAAGVDLALSLIEEDYGSRVALRVARELVVYFKRSGAQAQYSQSLKFQTESVDDFADLPIWMINHLHEDLSVESLATVVSLCSRQFSRRFKNAFGKTPAKFVEDLRLSEARRRLSAGAGSVKGVAASVGFRSADAFRRTFERRVGVNPSAYRDDVSFARRRAGVR
jgi:transcriptional regulator GlxA family with amidase domain